MEQGEIEKTTGYKINWRKFGGGGDVMRAMASGNVQIGEAGSSPIAAAASKGWTSSCSGYWTKSPMPSSSSRATAAA